MNLLIHLTHDPVTRDNGATAPLRWVIGPGVSDDARERFTRYFTAVNDQLVEERDQAQKAKKEE